MPTSSQIIVDIREYIRRSGGADKDWYVGISANPNDSLFKIHGVDRQKDLWTYRQASSSDEARMVEQAYLEAGCDVRPGGDGNDAVFVYAYMKNSRTNP